MMANSTLNLQHLPADEVSKMAFKESTNENLLPAAPNHHPQQQILTKAHLDSSMGPVKRKRGRPRKYTLGPYVSQNLKLDSTVSENTNSRARYSMPASYSTITGSPDPYSLVLASGEDSVYDLHNMSNFNSPLRREKSRSIPSSVASNKFYSHQVATTASSMTIQHLSNGHVSEITSRSDSNSNNVNDSSNNASNIAAGIAVSTNTSVHNTSTSTSNNPSNSFSFRYPSIPVAQQPASLVAMDYSMHSSSNTIPQSQVPLSSSPSSLVPPLTAMSRPRSPQFSTSLSSGYYNRNGLVNGLNNHNLKAHHAYGEFLPSGPSVVASPSPYPFLAPPVGTVANFEVNLIGRVLPQAEAAVCAARTAGLAGPHAWTPEMVASFVATLPGCQHINSVFTENEIDGAALLCLEQHDLMSVLKLKLGPAVKVFGAIRSLRRSMLLIPASDLCADQASAVAAAASCFPAAKKQNSERQRSPAAPNAGHRPRMSPHTNTSPTTVTNVCAAAPATSAFSIKKLTTANNTGSISTTNNEAGNLIHDDVNITHQHNRVASLANGI